MSKFIKDFQRQHGLVDDGVIGKQTLLKIKEVYNIPTNEATSHVVGNTYHETGGFEVFEENLNYSAQGLAMTFPSRYADKNGLPNELAKSIARNPEAIANNCYGGRMGNTDPGDGWKFKGRGALQTTGKTNYDLLGKSIGIDLLSHPELVATKYQFESAIFYFNSNKLWKMASTVDDESIRKVRKAVNGASIGLEDVNQKVKYFYNMIK